MICLGGLVIGHATAWELVQIFSRGTVQRCGAPSPPSWQKWRTLERAALRRKLNDHKSLWPESQRPPGYSLMCLGSSPPITLRCPTPQCPRRGWHSALPGIGVRHSIGRLTNGISLAITQAICLYRKLQATEGPLFLGIDTHALSIPAFATALEVLAANGVEVMIADGEEYTPTPVISHAILTYNRGRKTGLSDGIVITPSHNPPHDGGFKYNPCTGGPADTVATGWIESKANEILESRLAGVKRVPLDKARRASTTHRRDLLGAYVADLGNVVEMDVIRGAKLSLGVDPLGGVRACITGDASPSATN
jgi:hypothetical protein